MAREDHIRRVSKSPLRLWVQMLLPWSRVHHEAETGASQLQCGQASPSRMRLLRAHSCNPSDNRPRKLLGKCFVDNTPGSFPKETAYLGGVMNLASNPYTSLPPQVPR